MNNNLVEVKVNKSLGTIDSNLDEVEKSIKSYMADYENYVVSADTVKDSKDLLADLRKQQKALDEERKDIKKEWNAPFDIFEKRAKEVIALYDKPINLINGQLSKFEEDRKKKRKEDIGAIYAELKGDLGEYAPLSRIYNAQWENATTSLKSIREDMQRELDRISLEINSIKSMESKYEGKLFEEYKRTYDFHAVIQLNSDFRKQEEIILARQEAERKSKEEQERIKAAKAKPAAVKAVKNEEYKDFEEFAALDPDVELEAIPEDEPRLVTIIIKADTFWSVSIQALLDDNNIEYEVIE